jgi:hypothetical protein
LDAGAFDQDLIAAHIREKHRANQVKKSFHRRVRKVRRGLFCEINPEK